MLDANHCGRHLLVTAEEAVTITVPDSADLPIGTEIEILRYSAAEVSITCAETLYLLGVGSEAVQGVQTYQIQDRFGIAVLKKVYSDTWVIAGVVDLA